MKKILLSLGTLGAIAAPIGAVVSCGDKGENLAKKYIDMIDSTIKYSETKHAKNSDFIDEIKNMKTVGATFTHNSTSKDPLKQPDSAGFQAISQIINPGNESTKTVNYLKDPKAAEFIKKLNSKDENVKQSVIMIIEFKVLKAYKNSSIQLKMTVTMANVKPKIENLGTASKNITINFTK